MNERKVPEELAALDAELPGIGRRVQRQIDPGPAALGVSIAILVLIVALILPWTGPVRGWEVLAGIEPRLGRAPRLVHFRSPGWRGWGAGSPWARGCGRSGPGRSRCRSAAVGPVSGSCWPSWR